MKAWESFPSNKNSQNRAFRSQLAVKSPGLVFFLHSTVLLRNENDCFNKKDFIHFKVDILCIIYH